MGKNPTENEILFLKSKESTQKNAKKKNIDIFYQGPPSWQCKIQPKVNLAEQNSLAS